MRQLGSSIVRWEWAEPDGPAPVVDSVAPSGSRLSRTGPSRGRLLTAAVRVYGRAGWEGATTRGIANEAGVNEVTLFRQFGTKQALLTEALRESMRDVVVPLPDESHEPRSELIAWYVAQMVSLRRVRAVLQHCSTEQPGHDTSLHELCRTTLQTVLRQLTAYVDRLIERGQMLPDSGLPVRISMLTATVVADALWSEDVIDDDALAVANVAPSSDALMRMRYIDLFLTGIVEPAGMVP